MKMKDPNNMITVVLVVLLVLSAMQAFQLSDIDNQVTAAASLNSQQSDYPVYYSRQAQYPQPVRYQVVGEDYWRR